MKLASFNLENLFRRPTFMNESSQMSQQILKDYYDLSGLIEKEEFTVEDKDAIVRILRKYDGIIDNNNAFIKLNEIRGPRLLHKNAHGFSINWDIKGRKNWIGWFELNTAEVNVEAVKNTARVINAVGADVLGVVEVENRIAVNKFNEHVIPQVGGQKYDYTMVIDGNDDRGIDVGIMTKHGYEISSIATHIYDGAEEQKGPIFMRDCAEYTIQTTSEKPLLILVNHFKSQGGETDESDAMRIREARQVRKIYEQKLKEGKEYIAIIGDLNQDPDHFTLQPLIGEGSSLQDIMINEQFNDKYGLPWTHKRGDKGSKLDYILLSPKLQERVIKAGIERHGVWGIGKDEPYEKFPEIKSELDAASDHAALWVDLDI